MSYGGSYFWCRVTESAVLHDFFLLQGAYNATVRFGTLTDYFDAVRRRMSPGSFDTLAGDFHVIYLKLTI